MHDIWHKHPHRNLWQHDLWKRFQEARGLETFVVKTSFTAGLLIKRPLPFGKCWLECPRGPLFDGDGDFKKWITKVKELAAEQNAVFIRFSSYKEFPKWLKGKVAKGDHHPETSLVIDLEKPEDEILAQMKPKGRYNIKVADRHEVIVHTSDDIDAFYAMLQKTCRRDGFHIHPKKYYQTMLDVLDSHAQLLLAEYRERVVAGGIFVYLEDWGIYYYGSSDYDYHNVMAPYLIQWEAMKEAKRRGCKHYDFLGIAPEGAKNHPWMGVTRFKTRFGGKITDYPQARDLILQPWWYRAYRLYKKLT